MNRNTNVTQVIGAWVHLNVSGDNFGFDNKTIRRLVLNSGEAQLAGRALMTHHNYYNFKTQPVRYCVNHEPNDVNR